MIQVPSAGDDLASDEPRQRSAIKRLRELPPLFRGSEVTLKFDWDSKQASHYLWLWKKRGLLEPLGGHSDVYANLLVAAEANWEAALLMARPSAVVVGIECLRRAGWTTQVPARPQVAINPALGGAFSNTRFELEVRDKAWFESVRSARCVIKPESASDRSQASAPALRPACALADMLHRQGWGACGLQPDDVDWNVVTDLDRAQWARAVSAFGLQIDLPEMGESGERDEMDTGAALSAPRERQRG